MRLKWGIIFIYIFCTGYVVAAKVDCDIYNYENRGFDQSENGSLPPGNLTWPPASSIPTNQSSLTLEVNEIREDFNITTFAIPFIENESQCPRSLTKDSNLRQYKTTCSIMANAKQSVVPLEIYLEKIFTGCYYFMMTNAKDKNWVLGPAFYNTSYRYYDTKLKLAANITYKPEGLGSSMEVLPKLTIPLPCIQVRAQLFEFDAKIDNATDDIKNETILPSQECWFTKDEQRRVKCIKKSKLITKLKLEIVVVREEGDEWTVELTWKELKYGGGRYYLWFEPYTINCEMKLGYYNVNTWKPIDKDVFIDLGFQNVSNNMLHKHTSDELSDNPTFVLILYVLLGFTVTATLGYWIWKYSSSRRQKSLAQTIEQPEEKPYDERAGIKSDAILLLYVTGCPEFLNIIETLRKSLKSVCCVYDPYGAKEWCEIAELGANRWVEQLLEGGCRVVWVDTPEFRSRVNDKQYIVQDSREEVILFAVHWEKFFRDCTTQYLRHFVLQIEGFEVEDGSDDPLRLVSSLIRYRFPDHLSLLCDQLRSPEKL